MYVAMSLVKAGEIEYGLAIGADTSQGAPGDALEYAASAGAAAFIYGNENVLATVDFTHSYMTDTPDFWRREYQFYPRHAGRFTGEPAYFKHTIGASNAILEKAGMKPSDFAFAVFHQPNGKFPMRVGKKLGFTEEQMDQGWLAPTLGNTYSGASPIGLTAILDIAKPGDRIFMCSYGSGSGSDAFIYTATDLLPEVQDAAEHTRALLEKDPIYLEYGAYAKFRGKIKKLD
jgi:hydroxymethylglutaryl-CoA synthase